MKVSIRDSCMRVRVHALSRAPCVCVLTPVLTSRCRFRFLFLFLKSFANESLSPAPHSPSNNQSETRPTRASRDGSLSRTRRVECAGVHYAAGDMGRVNDELRDAIDEAVRATAQNSKLRLSVALSYGARQDIVAATRLLATKAGYGSKDGALGGKGLIHTAYTSIVKGRARLNVQKIYFLEAHACAALNTSFFFFSFSFSHQTPHKRTALVDSWNIFAA